MNSWPLVPLGEILSERQEIPNDYDLLSGRTRIVAKIGFQSGKIEMRSDGKTKTKMILIRPGDLVVSGINAAKGAIAIYEKHNCEPIAATIHYGAFIPNEEKADVRYLWWLLRSGAFREILAEYLPGGIKTELKAKRLLPIPIPLPPLAAQRRIVARIEALAGKIAEARGLRQQAVEETSILKTNTTERIISDAASEFMPLSFFLNEPLLNGLSIPASGIGSIGIRFAKVGIVNTGVFNPKETKRVNISLNEGSPYWMKNGDIFISRGNSIDLMGRTAVYEGSPKNCAYPDLLIRIRVNKNVAEPKFISYYFHSRTARDYLESQATGTSPSMKKISQPKLERMSIPLLPLGEQRRIVAYLDGLQAKVDALKNLQAETQRELEVLLPSVLEQAFREAL